MDSLSKFWKPILIAIIVLLVAFGLSMAYGKANQYWKMLKDQILEEQKAIQDRLENDVKTLSAQKKISEEQIGKLKMEREQLKKKATLLQGEKDVLAKKLASLIVPTAPDDMVRSFQQLGLRSAHTRPAK
jgi:cell division protein FtsL